MLFRLLIAFTLIPLVELYLLLHLANRTGVVTTVILVLVTGIIGMTMARSQGIRVFSRLQTAMEERRMPSRELQEGLLVAFAAALLLTPGILTDLFGFLLLIPVTRERIRRYLASRFKVRFQANRTNPAQENSPDDSYPSTHSWSQMDTIDAEKVRRVD